MDWVIKTTPEVSFHRGLGIHLDLNLCIALNMQKYIIYNARCGSTGALLGGLSCYTQVALF